MNPAYLYTRQLAPQAWKHPSQGNHYHFTQHENQNIQLSINDPDPGYRFGRGWILEKNGEFTPVMTLESVSAQRGIHRDQRFSAPLSGEAVAHESVNRSMLSQRDPLEYLARVRPMDREEGFPEFLLRR